MATSPSSEQSTYELDEVVYSDRSSESSKPIAFVKPPRTHSNDSRVSSFRSLSTALNSAAGGGGHSVPASMVRNKQARAMKSSALQSRIDVLEKTLKLRTVTNNSSPRRGSPQTSMLAPRFPSSKANHFATSQPKLQISSSFLSLMPSGEESAVSSDHSGQNDNSLIKTTLTDERCLVPSYGRNIRKEMADKKFDGLAMLFQSKMGKMKPGGDSSIGTENEDKELKQTQALQSDYLFARPRPTGRLPSRWLSQDKLVLPDSNDLEDNGTNKRNEFNYKPEKAFDEERSDEWDLTNSSFALEGISDQLSQLEHQHSIEQKVSFLLREFYKNCHGHPQKMSSVKLARYHNEIVFANKCLLVAAEKQLLIKEEIKRIQTRQKALKGMPPSVRYSEVLQGGSGHACLALRSIALPLQRRSANTFMFCLVRVQSSSKVTESMILNTSANCLKATRRGLSRIILFEFNELFEHLEPNFELSAKFYQMDLPDEQDGHLHHIMYRRLVKCLDTVQESKAAKFVKKFLQKRGLLKVRDDKNGGMVLALANADSQDFKVLNVKQVNMDNMPLAGSAFKQIGSISLNRSNWKSTRIPIDQFDYSWSVCQNEATLDCDLSIDYGPTEEVDHSFGVNLVTRQLDRAKIGAKQLHFGDTGKGKLKFSKCSVAIEKHYLKVRSKHSSFRFDLANCLNPIMQSSLFKPPPSVRGLSSTTCFIFAREIESDRNDSYSFLRLVNEAEKPLLQDFQFVFITSHKLDRLAEFYGRVMSRLHSVRQWQSPVMAKASLHPLLDHQNGDSPNEQNKPSDKLYCSLMDNLKVN